MAPYRRSMLNPPHPWDQVIVLANRAPVTHHRTDDGAITITRSASGVVTALEPIVDACGGTWVAHAAGDADMAAMRQRDQRTAPSDEHRYRLRYVDLDDDRYAGYYYGFANGGLWPLCHAVPVKPEFHARDYALYRGANRRFSAAVVNEAAGQPALVLVQD